MVDWLKPDVLNHRLPDVNAVQNLPWLRASLAANLTKTN
jgi:hypothetical protein